MPDTPVDIHLIVQPDLEKYGEIAVDAPRTKASLDVAETFVWVGTSKGAWTKINVPNNDHGSVQFAALLDLVEQKLAIYEGEYNEANPKAKLSFKLSSQIEADVYYYGAEPFSWCLHRFGIEAAPADSSDLHRPWSFTTTVKYKNAAGADVEKSLDVAVAISARFELAG